MITFSCVQLLQRHIIPLFMDASQLSTQLSRLLLGNSALHRGKECIWFTYKKMRSIRRNMNDIFLTIIANICYSYQVICKLGRYDVRYVHLSTKFTMQNLSPKGAKALKLQL